MIPNPDEPWRKFTETAKTSRGPTHDAVYADLDGDKLRIVGRWAADHGIDLRTANVIDTIDVRAMSMGPGACAVQIETNKGDKVGLTALPGVWTGWTVLAQHISVVSYSVSNTVICDSGVLVLAIVFPQVAVILFAAFPYNLFLLFGIAVWMGEIVALALFVYRARKISKTTEILLAT